jgi:nitrate reductase cytochrome c-type subunit
MEQSEQNTTISSHAFNLIITGPQATCISIENMSSLSNSRACVTCHSVTSTHKLMAYSSTFTLYYKKHGVRGLVLIVENGVLTDDTDPLNII